MRSSAGAFGAVLAIGALSACAAAPRPAAPERRISIDSTLRRHLDLAGPIDDAGPPRRIRVPLTLRAPAAAMVTARVTWLDSANQPLAVRPSPGPTPLYPGRQTFLDIPAPLAAAGWLIEVLPAPAPP